MHKNSIMGTICVYNWTDMMVDMGLDNIVNNYRDPLHARIFNVWIKDLDSDILITRDQDNEQRLLHKYNNLRFLDDEEHQTYMISPLNLEFKVPPELISSIVWLCRHSIGGMGIIWPTDINRYQ